MSRVLFWSLPTYLRACVPRCQILCQMKGISRRHTFVLQVKFTKYDAKYASGTCAKRYVGRLLNIHTNVSAVI